MESLFSIYLDLGFDHILDVNGYDHILFLVALCAIYQIEDWKKVVLLATAFTVGHSLTLAMAALDMVRFPTASIEVLIPVTIFCTALYNVIQRKQNTTSDYWIYILAIVFGFIHGMGFSNFFKAAMMPGMEEDLLLQLFAFNLGIELGQLIIIGIILMLATVFLKILQVPHREWNLFISGAAAGVAFTMMMERFLA